MATRKTHCKRGHAYARWGYAYTSPQGLTANRCKLCRGLTKRQRYRALTLQRDGQCCMESR